MRLSVVAACLSLCLIGFATANDAHASIRKDTSIPAEGLGPALNALARDRNFQIVYVTEEIANVRTAGAIGLFTTEEALKRLLVGTGLSYRYLDDKTVTILPVGSVSTQNERAVPTARDNQGSDVTDAQEGKKSSSGEFRVAQVAQGTTSQSATVESSTPGLQESSRRAQLTEIIVTAQKRNERLQDVPVPVTAVDANLLAERGASRLQDFFETIPGLNLNSSSTGGTQTIAIRGVTTGQYTNPTVAVTVDDVPYGSSGRMGLGDQLYPDIDPADLARIEVLRGPQGTLYGASSIGGLIKFVTVDPSTDAVSGRVQALGDNVTDGGFGYGVRGAINVPLSDALAFRISGFSRRDSGYVDNVATGQRDVNKVDVYGGRFAALWHISDAVSFKISALFQNTNGDGSAAVDTNQFLQPTFGDLQQSRLRGSEQYTSAVRLYTATFNAKLSSVDFTSISGYQTNKWFDPIDQSLAYGPSGQQFFGSAFSGAFDADFHETKKFTQEFRLSSSGSQTFEWLAGAFYTHETTPGDETVEAVDPATGSHGGVIVDFNYPTTFWEYALFGDLTIHFTDRFDIQFGGRESQSRQIYNETDTGPLFPTYYNVTVPFVNPTERTKGNAFTYLVTPRLKLTPDLMLYARFTSGYREGGTNFNAVVGQVPERYDPDRTYNYELGVKADLLDHSLTLDASVYYIDWKRVQINLLNQTTFTNFVANAGGAKSQGLELSLQSRPVRGLTISATASLNDAKLTQDLPVSSAAVGLSGDRMPYSSRFSGSLAIEQEFPLSNSWTGFVGGTLGYVGARQGEFPSIFAPQRLRFPAYAETAVRGGAKYDSWTFNLFVNNAANKRGIVGGNTTYAGSGYDAVYIQPRTVGLSVSKSF
jgi:iron complex outermembrane recepter protein